MILLVDGDEEQYITFRSMGNEAYLAGLMSGKDTDYPPMNKLIDATRRYLTSLMNYCSERNTSNIALH